MLAILGIVASPAMEFGKCIYGPIKRELNLLCCLKNNFKDLEGEYKKLEDKRNDLQLRVNTQKNNVQVIFAEVQTWLQDASDLQVKMDEIKKEYAAARGGGFSINPHYCLSRKVKKTTDDIIKHMELREKCQFNELSNPPPPPAVRAVSTSQGSASEFESRKDIEDGVMTSLRDDKVNMVGIWGMGGVGKTFMAKRIIQRMRDEGFFKEIVEVTVGKKVCEEAFKEAELLRIQDDVARSLGLDLGEGSLSIKAHLLRIRLSESEKKSLVVVDNVWGYLNLDELGIPCNNWCKVLLTSRDSHVIQRMNANAVHEVKVLSPSEAWDLFVSKVGNYIDYLIAKQVVEECKCLPIVLDAVGNALKNTKNMSVWVDSLQQLRSSNPSDMPDVFEGVYIPLRLSYDFLQNERAQSLFLLCCLFPEGYDIPLDELTFYAMRLDEFKEIKRIEDARNRVCSLVEMLQSRSLLLEGGSKYHVRMHDVVRDVAIFIACGEKLVSDDSKRNDCAWISPYAGESMRPTVFPNLQLLWIDCQTRDKELEIDDHFFEGMKKLNVLCMKWLSVQQLPRKTTVLENIQTLVLERCKSLKSISVIGELANLEILVCRWCSSIGSLPIERGRSSRLRLLEFSHCTNLKKIGPGIISNLRELEELTLVGGFNSWEAENTEEERKNASLSELRHLYNLSRLKIEIKDHTLASKYIHPLPNMARYHIKIGNARNYRKLQNVLYDKMMELQFPEEIVLENWIHKCFRSVEYMRLEGDGSGSLDLVSAHENIRMLVFRKCSTAKKLVSKQTPFPRLEVLHLEHLSTMEEICHIDGTMPSGCLESLKILRLESLQALKSIISPYPHNTVPIFSNLSSLYIKECRTLRSLFSSSMMRSGSSLVLLESLEIIKCDMMEQVLLWDGDEEENQIPLVFSRLKVLKLNDLPRLTSFSEGIKRIEFPALEEVEVLNCSLLKSFVFTTSSDRSQDNDNPATHISQDNGDRATHLSDKVGFDCCCCCSRFFHLSTSESPSIEKEEVRLVLDQQISLNFFATLRTLKLSNRNDLKSLFSTESSSLSQLEELQISTCNFMEEIINWNGEKTETKLFPKLKLLILHSLPRLRRLSKGIQFPLPADIQIIDCPLLGSCGSSSTTSSSDKNDDSIHLFCETDKVEYDGLKKLKVSEYGSMKRNWCPGLLMIDIFSGLEELRVYGIKGMKSLFSSSVARDMSRLRCLYIVSCNEMVRVIEDDDKETNSPFPNMEMLRLNKLRKLKTFCEWRHALQFSWLESLHIENCEEMEKFTSGPLNTPVLKRIYVDGDYLSLNGDGVNTLLQQRKLTREEEHNRRSDKSSVGKKVQDPVEIMTIEEDTSKLKGRSKEEKVEEPAEIMTIGEHTRKLKGRSKAKKVEDPGEIKTIENVAIQPGEAEEEQDRNPKINRPRRNRKTPNKYDDYVVG